MVKNVIIVNVSLNSRMFDKCSEVLTFVFSYFTTTLMRLCQEYLLYFDKFSIQSTFNDCVNLRYLPGGGKF